MGFPVASNAAIWHGIRAWWMAIKREAGKKRTSLTPMLILSNGCSCIIGVMDHAFGFQVVVVVLFVLKFQFVGAKRSEIV